MSDFFTIMEILQQMLESNDVEVIDLAGKSIRGKIDNLRSTQPFSKPAVKIKGTDGKIRKVLFTEIKEVIDHEAGNRKTVS